MAADVSNNGSISTGDLVEMRRLILGINDKFSKTDSWKFVPSDFVFDDPSSPFSQEIPESVTTMGNQEVAFTGYKMGDLNLNASTANLLGDDFAGDLELWIQDESFTAGEQVVVPVNMVERVDILGLGLEIEYDHNTLSFVGLQSETLNGLESSMYYDHPQKEGSVQLAWYDAYPSNLDVDEAVISLVFTAKDNSDIKSAITIQKGQLSTAVITNGAELLEKEISTNIKENISVVKLYQNQPNPFSSETVIQFDLLKSDQVNFEIVDISGKTIYQRTSSHSKGANQIVVNAHDLPSTGIFYYRLQAGDFIETKKLIHIK